MRATSSSHDWLMRFSIKLMELVPGLTGPMALRRALLRFPEWRDANPEFAARAYIESRVAPQRERALLS